jgi:hypothetical protein
MKPKLIWKVSSLNFNWDILDYRPARIERKQFQDQKTGGPQNCLSLITYIALYNHRTLFQTLLYLDIDIIWQIS